MATRLELCEADIVRIFKVLFGNGDSSKSLTSRLTKIEVTQKIILGLLISIFLLMLKFALL